MKPHALIFSMLLFSPLCLGQDDIVAAGSGVSSCGRYLSGRSENDSMLNSIYGTWLQGFFSGVNVHRRISGKEMISIPDSESLLFYVEKFCRDNPLRSVYEASIALVREQESKGG